MRISDWSSDVCSSDLAEIDAYARAKDPRVRQVAVSLSGSWQAVQIIRGDGVRVADIRPLVRLGVTVTVGDGTRMENGAHGTGGRVPYAEFIDPDNWRGYVDEARSEEHPSELQSLMRISYAVSCL